MLLKWFLKKLIGSHKFITYPCWICKGWRSPIGNPSEVKNLSNSLASNNVTESRGPSLWPSNCSDERGNEPVLRRKKKLCRFIKSRLEFSMVRKSYYEQKPEKYTHTQNWRSTHLRKKKSKIFANHLESKHIFKNLYVGYRKTCSYHVKTMLLLN